MRSARWAIFGLFVACEADPAGLVSNGEAVPYAAVDVAVMGPTSDRPDTLLVRAVDADLTSSGPATVTALVDGEPFEVEIDARGYGTLTLSTRGAVTLGGLGEERAVLHDQPFRSAWGRAHAPLPDVGAIEPASVGALVGSGSEVWWVGPGLPPHVVARVPGGAAAALRALPVDDDGVLDAVVWAGEQVVLLRGREEGGASFGARVVAAGWEARGADVRDFDGDGRRDLAIAWTDGAVGILQVWAGDGAWGFAPMIERTIASPPLDLAAASDRGDGAMIATALTEDGGWQRLLRDDASSWRLTGPPLSIEAVAGTRIRSGGDFDGSGADNLVVIPPRVDGTPREIAVWSLDAEPPRFVRASFVGGHLAFGPLEGDGRPNILGLDQATAVLTYITWVGDQATSREAATLPEFGPIGLGQVDVDPTPDLLLAGEVLRWFPGIDDRDEVRRWRPTRPGGGAFGLGLDGPVAASDAGQVIAVTRQGETLRVSELRFDGLAPAADAHVAVGPADDPVLELVHCGDSAWALTATDAIQVEVRQRVVARRTLASPRALTCAPGVGGAVAALVDTGEAVLLGDGAAVIERVPLTDAAGVAVLADGSVVGCAGPCVVARESAGDVLAVGGPQGLTVSGPAGERTLPGAEAQPSLVDLDGDGQSELVWRWGADLVGVARIVEGELAAPEWLHLHGVGPGAPIAAGLADGERDLWFREGQRLRSARAP